MARALHLKRRAFRDIDELTTYVSERSGPLSAKAWQSGLMDRVASLKNDAAVWPLSEDAEFAAMGYRELLYRRHQFVYRIFYRIDGETVFVHRVRSAFQDELSAGDLV